jgi:hypothetical protein
MSNVIKMDLTPVSAHQMIVEIVGKSTGFVIFTDHAVKQMVQRRITRPQVISCLMHGTMIEGPFRSVKGNWQLTVESVTCGEVLTVGAALEYQKNNNIIVVITAI